MMSWREARLYGLAFAVIAGFIILFSFNMVWEEPSGCRWFLGLGLIGFFAISLTIGMTTLFGYYYRDVIDPGDETPVDLSKTYLGGVFAVILTPIARPLFDHLGC